MATKETIADRTIAVVRAYESTESTEAERGAVLSAMFEEVRAYLETQAASPEELEAAGQMRVLP